MKITKLPYAQDEKKIAKNKALEGCNVCPYCGENKRYHFSQLVINSIQNNTKINYEGIEYLGEYTYGSMFAMFKRLVVSRYKCRTCGAEWESEPYKKVG